MRQFRSKALLMTKTYADVVKQIEVLSREAEKLKRKEVEGVIARIREAIAAYGLTASDLGLGGRRGPRPAGAVRRPGRKAKAAGKRAPAGARPAKFRDENGNSWGGRGPRPQWLRDALANGKKLEDFAV
jgi:DNA-binding protein H-NS